MNDIERERVENLTGKLLNEYFTFLPQIDLQHYVLRGNRAAANEMRNRKRLGTWNEDLGVILLKKKKEKKNKARR
jgi:hypothetical protein